LGIEPHRGHIDGVPLGPESDQRVARVENDGAEGQAYLRTHSPRSVWIHWPSWTRCR
jgi:hypothetical protein